MEGTEGILLLSRIQLVMDPGKNRPLKGPAAIPIRISQRMVVSA